MAMADGLNLLMRWLHIASAACLTGGMIYGWIVARAAAGLPPEASTELGDRVAAAFRPLVALSMAFLLISGIYNVLSNPGHSLRYYVLLSLKLLLVAHMFAVAVIVTQPGNQRRGRLMAGGAISALVVIGIAAYLRRIF